MLPEGHKAKWWHQGWPLALLCLLASVVWLALDRYPQITFTPASDAIACAAAAILTIVVALTSRQPRPPAATLLRCGFGSALLLVGPSIGSFFHAQLDSGALTITLALTPVVIAVADSNELTGDNLWPGLMATAALLLVLPAPSLSDVRNDLALLLAPVLTGIGCVLYRSNPTPTTWKTPATLAAAALLITAAALTRRPFQQIATPAAVIEAALFLLALIALSRITPAQYASRYAAVPLLILLQGPLLLHSVLTWRAAICGVLLAAAAIALLRTAEVPAESLEDHSLRG